MPRTSWHHRNVDRKQSAILIDRDMTWRVHASRLSKVGVVLNDCIAFALQIYSLILSKEFAFLSFMMTLGVCILNSVVTVMFIHAC